MKRRHFGDRSRYIIIVSLFLIMLNITLGIILINLSKKALITQIEGRMLDITNTAADMLDGDKLKKLKKEDFYTDDYQDAIKMLEHFQRNIQLEYIYCIQSVGEKKFAFSVDPTKDDPGEFGSPIVYTDALYQASKGEASVDKEPYEDKWGRFYSAYSPVFDSKGNVALIVAVDFSADWYNEQVNTLAWTVLVICVLSLLAGGLVVIIITQRTHKNNRRLYEELNSLADNIEDLVKEVNNTAHMEYIHDFKTDSESSGDDIRDLSKKIETMQDNLRSEIVNVHRMAYIDALTAVGNTAAYMEAVSVIDSQIVVETAKFSVAAFDLNGLKRVNDNYGHNSGDNMLIDTANVLCRVFGKDNIFRVGGDEFMAIVLTTSADEMNMLFKKFDIELEKENEQEKSYHFPISVSKGYSIYMQGQDGSYKNVALRADIIMYQNKDEYYKHNNDADIR